MASCPRRLGCNETLPLLVGARRIVQGKCLVILKVENVHGNELLLGRILRLDFHEYVRMQLLKCKEQMVVVVRQDEVLEGDNLVFMRRDSH